MKKIFMVSGLIMILGLIALQVMAKEVRGPMKPIAPLMIEHRLIERMVGVMEDYVTSTQAGKKVNPVFIDTVLDFFRIYGDKTHHAKEEDILFAELAKKNLSPDHKKMLEILIDDHVQARKLMVKLAEVNKNYVKGNADTGNDIITYLNTLTVLYRKHIELEDKHFFIPSLGYFTKDEMNTMLSDMWEYDRNMIHIKYRQVVGQAKEMIGQ
ncbi:MAG: hemerythrin domain-containing protein [Syntrophaceae bacterium]